MKILGPLLLALGEALSIYAEVRAAKDQGWSGFWRGVAWIAPGGVALVGGYILTGLAWRSIWVPTVVSIGSILVLEPVIVLAVSGEKPSTRTLVAFGLGAAGLLVALSDHTEAT